jgi:apolipoprotein N-acyltransferase
MDFFKRKNHFFLAAFLSGILIGTSYIPYPAWAVFFCYIPLCLAVIQAEKQNLSLNVSLKMIFALGWVTQFTLSLIGFHWIYYTATEFGGLHPLLAATSLFLFAAVMHIYIPIALVIATWIKRTRKISDTKFIFLLFVSLILSERIWPSIFEWNLGYTLLWMKWPLFQWADTVGFWGLSSFIFIIQACLVYFIYNLNHKKMKYQFLSLFIVLVILHFTGLAKQKKWSDFDDVFRVTVTQANISNEDKLASEKGENFRPFVLQSYIDLTNQHLNTLTKKPDAILWPETALPFPLDDNFMNRPVQQSLKNQLNIWQTVLLTGGYSQDLNSKDHLGHYKVRNSIFFLDGQTDSKKQPQPYFKSDLLVFGEWMPLGLEFPILYEWLPFVGVYEKGPGPVLKTMTTSENKKFNLGPQICYESLNPKFSRGLSTSGADIIFNTTNDSWYGEGTEPFQHMIMTLARGIEVRRPLVRSTNTGFSSAILANGELLERSPMNQPWIHTYDINYKKNAELSHYTKFGHFDYIIWILILLFILFSKGRHVRD